MRVQFRTNAEELCIIKSYIPSLNQLITFCISCTSAEGKMQVRRKRLQLLCIQGGLFKIEVLEEKPSGNTVVPDFISSSKLL